MRKRGLEIERLPVLLERWREDITHSSAFWSRFSHHLTHGFHGDMASSGISLILMLFIGIFTVLIEGKDGHAVAWR